MFIADLIGRRKGRRPPILTLSRIKAFGKVHILGDKSTGSVLKESEHTHKIKAVQMRAIAINGSCAAWIRATSEQLRGKIGSLFFLFETKVV